MASKSKKPYRIGYKKPPAHSRFRPGQSGNPKGRPKGVKNLAAEYKEEAAGTILITEGGTTKRVTKFRAVIKRLFAMGIQGNVKAMIAVMSYYGLFSASSPDTDPTEQLNAEDQAILEEFLKDLASDNSTLWRRK